MVVTNLENEVKTFCLKNQMDFNIKQILECGQCFRWKKIEDNDYIGVIKEGVLRVKQLENEIIFEGILNGKIEDICSNYFDLERNYSEIKEVISKDDKNMQNAIFYGSGIRILNQEPWEMLISYIISAANNIPRISKTIENISREYGKMVEFQGEVFYLFPTPEELSKAKIEDLRKLNLGFRDKYVYAVTQKIANGEVNLENLKNMSLKDAKKELMKLPGIGAKVADCILLFSMGKKEAFPVDTWIKKVMNELYIESTNITKINEYALNKFGNYAGIAQQYLFYYKRES